ncbi:MAG: MOSC domain-containing protein [Paracoccaceae bacterium]
MIGARLTHIVRHPIKSVGFEEITRAALTEGRPFPHDRRWAIATEALTTDADVVDWHPKMRFVRGAAEGTLQAIRISHDPDTGTVRLTHPARDPFEGRLPEGAAALVDWVRPMWPANRPAPSRLVRCVDDAALSDQPEPLVSILNLASLRALEGKMGQSLSIHRFRGNLWIDGCEPWAEFGWIGQTLAIGPARLRIEARITRCIATTFDPDTGHPAGDTLDTLQSGWGHQDLGVFARVIQSGTVAIDDPVEPCA